MSETLKKAAVIIGIVAFVLVTWGVGSLVVGGAGLGSAIGGGITFGSLGSVSFATLATIGATALSIGLSPAAP